MLIVKEGNLFREYTVPGVIVHGANARGVMGSGVAKQFREAFPEAYYEYINQPSYTLGDVICTEYGDLTVCSAITQQSYGYNKNVVYADYTAIEAALTKVADLANSRPIYLPYIGGGLANGNRELLLKIFNRVFYQSTATLFIL